MLDIHVSVLGSSSFGNCSIIYNNANEVVMVDCGFTAKYIEEKLSELNLSVANIKALFITHIHDDHVKSSFLRKLINNNIPIYLHKTFELHLFRKYKYLQTAKRMGIVKVFDTREIDFSNFLVSWFSVPHDAKGGCYGYRIIGKSSQKVVTIATDLGFPKENLIPCFVNSDIIILESNHDVIMLENSDRSDNLKNRIKTIGHLSNVQSSQFVSKIIQQSKTIPSAIILSHISQECNTNMIAVSNMAHQLECDGFECVDVVETFKTKLSQKVSV